MSEHGLLLFARLGFVGVLGQHALLVLSGFLVCTGLVKVRVDDIFLLYCFSGTDKKQVQGVLVGRP